VFEILLPRRRTVFMHNMSSVVLQQMHSPVTDASDVSLIVKVSWLNIVISVWTYDNVCCCWKTM